jgi:hypothetical protein
MIGLFREQSHVERRSSREVSSAWKWCSAVVTMLAQCEYLQQVPVEVRFNTPEIFDGLALGSELFPEPVFLEVLGRFLLSQIA